MVCRLEAFSLVDLWYIPLRRIFIGWQPTASSFLMAWHTPSNILKYPLPIKYLSSTPIIKECLHKGFTIVCSFTSQSRIWHIFKIDKAVVEKYQSVLFFGSFQVFFKSQALNFEDIVNQRDGGATTPNYTQFIYTSLSNQSYTQSCIFFNSICKMYLECLPENLQFKMYQGLGSGVSRPTRLVCTERLCW